MRALFDLIGGFVIISLFIMGAFILAVAGYLLVTAGLQALGLSSAGAHVVLAFFAGVAFDHYVVDGQS